jgi:hypothetical protein
LNTEDEESSLRPAQVPVPESVDFIYCMTLTVRRISGKRISVTLAISRERGRYIIHEILDMRKLSAKWIPKCLNADQKRVRVFALPTIWNRFWRNPVGFLNRLLPMDQTLIRIIVYLE